MRVSMGNLSLISCVDHLWSYDFHFLARNHNFTVWRQCDGIYGREYTEHAEGRTKHLKLNVLERELDVLEEELDVLGGNWTDCTGN